MPEPTGPEPTTPAAPMDGGSKTFTQDDLDRIVSERLQRERSKYEGFDDLKAKAEQFDELKRSQQSDLERVTGERDTFKTTAERQQQENLRLKVAVKKGLVDDRAFIADRLQGSTIEELEADADALLEQLKPPPVDFDGGARGPAPSSDGDMNSLLRRAAGRA